MPDEFDSYQPKRRALYTGVVTVINDPLKAGRVKLRILGVIEPESDWVWPIGSPGGGEEALGFFAVPPVGAEVAVFFHQGDVEQPRYMPGHWGAPGGKTQAPTPVQDPAVTPEDAPNIRCFETPDFLLLFDGRPGHRWAALTDKVSGDGFSIDAETRAVQISGTLGVSIKAVGAVSIEGLNVTINGRPVRNTADPI